MAGRQALTIEIENLAEATIADFRTAMVERRTTAESVARWAVERIENVDRAGPAVNAVVEVNPDWAEIAAALDRERASHGARGPLHGIPVLLKDSLDTTDRLETTAGSLALVGSRPPREATVVSRLRAAGAVVLGKTNLSEWANFRSTQSTSGWSARGGQTRNPHVLDHNPSGSSSGSAAAVAAGYVPVAIGTETDGSIVSPAGACGVVGLKPTVGLVSRAGVVPIAHSQDTVGPLARSVADAAAVLGPMLRVDPRDPATAAGAQHSFADYTRFLDPAGLRGARIGVARNLGFGSNAEVDAVVEAAIDALRDAGATIVDPVEVHSAGPLADETELEVLLFEFKAGIEAYLAQRSIPGLRTLADLVAFNDAHAAKEMPFFGQDLFLQALEKGPLTDPAYLAARERSHRLSRTEGLDAALDRYDLDALVAPTGGPAWATDHVHGDRHDGGTSSLAAMAGYPLLSVPAGFVGDLPVNVTFMGRAFAEPTLIRLGYAFEHTTQGRRAPRFLATPSTG